MRISNPPSLEPVQSIVTGNTPVVKPVWKIWFESLADAINNIVGTKFIIQQASDSFPNAQSTGDLGTGVIKNTTATGVLSIAISGTDYLAPGGTSTTAGSTGSAALPATPKGFLTVNISGTNYKIPYYPL